LSFTFAVSINGLMSCIVLITSLSGACQEDVAVVPDHTKIVSRCRRTLRSEGHSFRQWASANCAAPPTADDGQYATSNCSGFRESSGV